MSSTSKRATTRLTNGTGQSGWHKTAPLFKISGCTPASKQSYLLRSLFVSIMNFGSVQIKNLASLDGTALLHWSRFQVALLQVKCILVRRPRFALMAIGRCRNKSTCSQRQPGQPSHVCIPQAVRNIGQIDDNFVAWNADVSLTRNPPTHHYRLA